MNFLAFYIALIGVGLIYFGLRFARKTSSKFWANTLRVASAVLSFLGISLAPAWLKMPTDSVNKIGMYWLYLLVAMTLFIAIKKRWKKRANDDS